MESHITTYGEARQAAFRHLVLKRRLEGLQRETQLLEEKVSSLRQFGLELEADLLMEDLIKIQHLSRRIAYCLEAGVDLVTALAPTLQLWAA